jgi:hypothetical protein
LVYQKSSIHHSFHSLKASSSCIGISVGDWSREVESLYLTELSSECISVVEAFALQKDFTATLVEKAKMKRKP